MQWMVRLTGTQTVEAETAEEAKQIANQQGRTWHPDRIDVLPSVDDATGERIAWDRDESDACERGTPGCSIHHTSDTSCQTW